MLYPDIYYKVQPYILSACDEMNSYGYGVPTQKVLQNMSDKVYAEVTEAYPQLEDSCTGAMAAAMQRGGYNGRGLFRDFLDILLLNELFGRRGRW